MVSLLKNAIQKTIWRTRMHTCTRTCTELHAAFLGTLYGILSAFLSYSSVGIHCWLTRHAFSGAKHVDLTIVTIRETSQVSSHAGHVQYSEDTRLLTPVTACLTVSASVELAFRQSFECRTDCFWSVLVATWDWLTYFQSVSKLGWCDDDSCLTSSDDFEFQLKCSCSL